MYDQMEVGRCAMTIANVMKEYAKLGTDDCYEVNSYLKKAMGLISEHLTDENQMRFADWLFKESEKMLEGDA